MMKRFLIAVALMLVVVNLSAVTGKKKSKKQEPPPKPVVMGTAAGMVKNVAGDGIPNVTLTVWDEKKRPVTMQSNASGEFRFQLAEGTYELAAAGPHLIQAVQAHIVIVVHGNTETWVNVVMNPAP